MQLQSGVTKKSGSIKRINRLQGFAMITPQLIGFLVFTLYPILWVVRYAWYDFDMVRESFVGFDNFIRIFTRDPDYWRSIGNTLILAFGKLAVELPLALLLAVLLCRRNTKGKAFFRTIFFLPNIISTAIVGLVFSLMFSSFDGIINNILQSWGAISAPVDWFGSKWTAMVVIGLVSIWQGFGINVLFFITGLVGIPDELYECAQMDGANAVRQFFSITLPMLAPVMKVIVMMAILGSLKMNELVMVLTNGGPAGGTEVVMLYLFKKFFAYSTPGVAVQLGYAAALGVVTSILLGLLTAVYLRMSRKMDDLQ